MALANGVLCEHPLDRDGFTRTWLNFEVATGTVVYKRNVRTGEHLFSASDCRCRIRDHR